MSGDTSRKGGENSIFGPAIAEFATVCTKAALDGAGSVRNSHGQKGICRFPRSGLAGAWTSQRQRPSRL